jgi:hypothetical protein
MSRKVIHKACVRPMMGGEVNSTVCRRFVLGKDGMNSTSDPKEVTCKFCHQKMAGTFRIGGRRA